MLYLMLTILLHETDAHLFTNTTQPLKAHRRISVLFFYYVTRVTANRDGFDEPHKLAF